MLRRLIRRRYARLLLRLRAEKPCRSTAPSPARRRPVTAPIAPDDEVPTRTLNQTPLLATWERVRGATNLAEMLKKYLSLGSAQQPAGSGNPRSGGENVIVLGDFNIFTIEDETFKALTRIGFEVPEELIKRPGKVYGGKQGRDRVPLRGVGACGGTTFPNKGRIGQAATLGSPTRGSSLIGAMLSRVM